MPVTPTPSITPAPEPPQRLTDSRAAFVSKADAYVAWQAASGPQYQAVGEAAEANAQATYEAASELAGVVAVASDGANLVAQSNSSLTAVAGVKVVTFLEAKPILATLHRRVAIVQLTDPSIRMFGEITAVASASQVTVTVDENGVFGSGNHDRWQVIDAAFYASGATATEVRAGVTEAAAVTPKALADAVPFGPLTDAATVAWDAVADGVHVRLTLTANGHTVGAPTGLIDGMTYVLNINPATYTCSWASIWDFGQVGPPGLPASAWSKVTAQYNADRGKLEAAVWRGA
ncbi:hypothetical protein [Phenylobacterium sp.]|uniref:hypothetical protein n=1 Tax=Phenylobacterium sp. TaxID=1871053 RepID=UPI00301D0926